MKEGSGNANLAIAWKYPGKIREVIPATYSRRMKPFPEITIEAESYLWMQGVQTQHSSNVGGGMNVAHIDTGDWMSYPEVTIPSTGAYTVEYRISSGSGGGTLQLEKAGGTPVYGTVSIQNTGGWQNWQTVSHTVNLDAGPIAFGIKAIVGGWNINWFRITKN